MLKGPDIIVRRRPLERRHAWDVAEFLNHSCGHSGASPVGVVEDEPNIGGLCGSLNVVVEVALRVPEIEGRRDLLDENGADALWGLRQTFELQGTRSLGAHCRRNAPCSLAHHDFHDHSSLIEREVGEVPRSAAREQHAGPGYKRSIAEESHMAADPVEVHWKPRLVPKQGGNGDEATSHSSTSRNLIISCDH